MNKSVSELVVELQKTLEINQQQLADKIGVSQPTVSRWEKGTQPDRDQLRALAEIDPKNSPATWLGMDPVAAPGGAQAMPATSPEPFMSGKRDLPVRGRAKAGEDGHYIEETGVVTHTFRPQLLEGVPDAYAVEVWDESMHPVLRHGWMLWVHPSKPVRTGDAVVIQLNDGQALVKELVKRTDKEWIFHQYKPEKDVRYARDKVKAVHLVVGNSRGML